MKYIKAAAILLALVMCLSLSACGGAESKSVESAEGGITVTDLIGREISVVPGSYSRVACIGAGALRMYCYIGDTALLCGVEDIDNLKLEDRPKMFDSVARPYVLAYGSVFESLPSCGVGGPNAQAADAERILSCNPDIVLSEYEDVEKEDALQAQIGVPVITLRSGSDAVFDDNFAQSMELLGKIFGKEDRARELNAFIKSQRDEITSRTAAVKEEDKPNVYICGLGNWGTTNHLTTAPDHVALKIANIKNVASFLPVPGIQEIEEEAFVELGGDIDIMIIDAAAVKNIAPLYAEDPQMFSTCKAWNNGEVYLQMAYNAYYTNHEISLINSWFIAKSVYPDLFEDIDIKAKSDEITKMFLCAELSEKIAQCPASYGGYQKIDVNTFFE